MDGGTRSEIEKWFGRFEDKTRYNGEDRLRLITSLDYCISRAG